MKNKDKIKIRFYKKHVAYIEREMIEALEKQCNIKDFEAWIKGQIEADFSMEIKNVNDIDTLTLMVRKRYYENIAEWIRERARRELFSVSDDILIRKIYNRVP